MKTFAKFCREQAKKEEAERKKALKAEKKHLEVFVETEVYPTLIKRIEESSFGEYYSKTRMLFSVSPTCKMKIIVFPEPEHDLEENKYNELIEEVFVKAGFVRTEEDGQMYWKWEK